MDWRQEKKFSQYLRLRSVPHICPLLADVGLYANRPRTARVYSAQMRAVIITRPGGPEGLEIREIEKPRPGPGEVLVRVHASALNRADVLQRHKTSRAWNLPAKSLRWANAQLVGARGSAFSASLPEVLTRNI